MCSHAHSFIDFHPIPEALLPACLEKSTGRNSLVKTTLKAVGNNLPPQGLAWFTEGHNMTV
jgi:hypothetical protein